MDTATVTAITSAMDFNEILRGIGGIFAALVMLKVSYVAGRFLLKTLHAPY